MDGPLPITPELGAEPGGEGDTEAEVQAFTLVPPSATFDLKLVMLKDLINSRDDPGSSKSWRNRSRGRASSTGDETFKLGHSNTGDNPYPYQVLIRAEGGYLTVDAMRDAIDRDGTDRNLPWRLRMDAESFMPVSLEDWKGFAPEKTIDTEDRESRKYFERLIVSFSDATEARRFVRNWHKREIGDAYRDEAVIINTTSLW
jgi:hypothetical protein